MDDIRSAGLLFLAFAVALILYGALLAATGSKSLLPYRAAYSVRGPHDVKRVGRIVVVVGLVIGCFSLLVVILRS